MPVIKFEHVSKVYRPGAGQTSLRGAISDAAARALRRKPESSPNDVLWALNEISFDVNGGEITGVIGHNGAGKSTILKLLARVTSPTSGHIRTKGRVAALIELGAGFHPDLTGRQNVFLNGVILGLKRREVAAAFSSIVDFAGLERFIDVPVKRYSSGMYLRLAFAIAIHVKADLLLVDEVLSVGDAAFQQKCLERMRDMNRRGVTILFVSHDLWSVSTFCRRAILLRAGRIQAEGEPDEVVQAYRRQDKEDLLQRMSTASMEDEDQNRIDDALLSPGLEVLISQIELLDQEGHPKNAYQPEEALLIRVHAFAPQPIDAPVFLVRIRRPDGLVCCELVSRDEVENWPSLAGESVVEVCIGPLQLVPDVYSVEVIIADNLQPILYGHSSGTRFQVNGILESSDRSGVFKPEVQWYPPR